MDLMLWELWSELLAAGLEELSITYVPTPKQRCTKYCGGEGWLVILGTGFNKMPHLPISHELIQQLRAILVTEEQPAWWSMRLFTYPSPDVWLKYEAK